MARQDERLSTRGERSSPHSVDLRHDRFTIEANFILHQIGSWIWQAQPQKIKLEFERRRCGCSEGMWSIYIPRQMRRCRWNRKRKSKRSRDGASKGIDT